MEMFEKPTAATNNPKVVPESGACPVCSWGRLMARDWNRRPPEEKLALEETGLTGELIEGVPVVRAVLLLRRVRETLPGAKIPTWVDCFQPAFRCPWSQARHPAILSHGGAYRSECGRMQELDLNDRGCFHRSSHCAAPGAPRGYFVRPILRMSLLGQGVKRGGSR